MNYKDMTVEQYAQYRLDEATRNDEESYVIKYWIGYLDGCRSQKEEDIGGRNCILV